MITARAYGISHRGLVRKNNEDALCFRPLANGAGRWALWAVADGMGGGARGELASRLALETLFETIEQSTLEKPADDLYRAVAAANARVWEAGTGGGQATRSAMGTTLVAALVDLVNGHGWIANVGDSRAYRVANGRIEQLTQDDSVVALQVAAGQLRPEEARSARNRNVVTRGIGTEPSVDTDIIIDGDLAAGTRLLLCSDGLHGLVPDEEIRQLTEAGPVEECAARLVQAANAHGGHDNVTALVAEIGGAHGLATAGAAVLPWVRMKPPHLADELDRTMVDRRVLPARPVAVVPPLSVLLPLSAIATVILVAVALGIYLARDTVSEILSGGDDDEASPTATNPTEGTTPAEPSGAGQDPSPASPPSPAASTSPSPTATPSQRATAAAGISSATATPSPTAVPTAPELPGRIKGHNLVVIQEGDTSCDKVDGNEDNTVWLRIFNSGIDCNALQPGEVYCYAPGSKGDCVGFGFIRNEGRVYFVMVRNNESSNTSCRQLMPNDNPTIISITVADNTLVFATKPLDAKAQNITTPCTK